MKSPGKTIARNAGVLMVSQLITWGLALAITIVQPRYLGAIGVGQLHLALSLWSVMELFVAFGTDTLLIKEIARTPERMGEFFGTASMLRILFFAIGFVLLALYAHAAGYSSETISVIYIIGLGSLLNQFSSVCRVSLQGLERMEFTSISDIASKVFNVGVGVPLLVLGFDVKVIAVVIVGSYLTNLLIHVYYLSQLQRLHLLVDWQLAKWMLRKSVPYLMVTVMLGIYVQLDIVIISLLVDEQTVGWYGAADTLFATFLFVPTVFVTAVFPALSRMYKESADTLAVVMRNSFDLLLIVAVPLGLGLFAIAGNLAVLLFGADFANSGPVLAVMGIVLILTYQNILLGKFLISVDRQNTWTKVMAVATVATIPLDLLLVSWCKTTFNNGAIGGALAFVVTESGMVIAGLWLLPRGTLGRENVWRTVRVLVAGLIMLVMVWPLRQMFILIPIATGTMVYLVMIWVLRVVKTEEWQLIRGLGQQMLKWVNARRSVPVH